MLNNVIPASGISFSQTEPHQRASTTQSYETTIVLGIRRHQIQQPFVLMNEPSITAAKVECHRSVGFVVYDVM